MENIQKFMIKHPLLSMAMILPFSIIIVIGVFSILINFILPVILAFWLSGWVYTAIVGEKVQNITSSLYGSLDTSLLYN